MAWVQIPGTVKRLKLLVTLFRISAIHCSNSESGSATWGVSWLCPVSTRQLLLRSIEPLKAGISYVRFAENFFSNTAMPYRCVHHKLCVTFLRPKLSLFAKMIYFSFQERSFDAYVRNRKREFLCYYPVVVILCIKASSSFNVLGYFRLRFHRPVSAPRSNWCIKN
jgi:hypothetical protein